MKIGIHQEPSGPGIGGSEFVTAVLAHALQGRNQVEIVHHREGLTKKRLAEFFHVDLDGVTWRYCPPSDRKWLNPDDRWWRLRSDLARWRANLSQPYDFFITVTHMAPPFCHAPNGVLYVLFPGLDRWQFWPRSRSAAQGFRGVFNGLRWRLYERAWQARLKTYRTRLAISRFSAQWIETYWGIRCGVLPPPVEMPPWSAMREKTNQIVTLGRITPCKKQRELTETFRKASGEDLSDWTMANVGSLSEGKEDVCYFDEIRAVAGSALIRFVTNPPREAVWRELGRSKIFWHAMGYGADEAREPIRLEHFGIATVEAMAAGCVPVVINAGGQREIVEHGINGFLCENLDEIAETTACLARDKDLLNRMSIAAQARAQLFSRDRFVRNFISILNLPLS